MSIIFRIDSNLSHLKDILIEDFTRHKSDIFQCSYIITTGEGVANWINENIAKTNGIHAHYKYLTIQEVLTQISKSIKPQQKIISHQDLVWLIYDVLFEGHSKDKEINAYFKAEPVSCCMMIADLFDKYQMYRPDMIQHWENQDILYKDNTLEQWQREIWLAVEKKISQKNYQRSLYGMLQDLKKLEKDDFAKIKNEIPALFIFNILGITPIQKEILEKISEVIPVYVYIKHIEYQSLEDWSNVVNDTLRVWDYNLLPMKREILKNKLQLHAHFSIKREIEGWYNYLVHQQDDTMDGRKIWVAVPDIKAYAPYIRAVMDNAPEKLHYTIADEVHFITDETIRLYAFMLQLDYDSFNIDQLIQLCRYEIIQKKYGIEDVDFITEALITSKARRKFDFHDEDRNQYSINKGIKRLILGIFTDDDVKVNDVYPTITTDDYQTQLNLIGLAQLVDQLEDFLMGTSTLHKQNIQFWMYMIDSMMNNFIDIDDETQEDSFAKINATLYSIKSISSNVPEISFSEVRKYLLSTIEDQQTKTLFVNTGITFSSMLPYRGLPFDYIAILGLNNDFPARNHFNAYDLTSLERRAGDRNVTDNDNHLILEAIDSASKKTYFSYLGINQNTLKTEYPSTVLSRLFDIKSDGIQHPLRKGMGRNQLHHIPDYYHQLQYQSGDQHYQHYQLQENREENNAQFTIKDVINFCSDSIAFHYKKIKNIIIPEETEIPIYETLELNHLESWSLKNELISIIIQHHQSGNNFTIEDLQIFLKNKEDKAELGLKSKEIIEQMTLFYQDLNSNIEPHLIIKEIEIEAFSFNQILIDKIEGYWDENNNYYFISPSSKKDKYKLQAYINGLLLMHYQNLPQIHINTSFKGQIFEVITFYKSDIEALDNLLVYFNDYKTILFPLLLEMIEYDDAQTIIDHLQNPYSSKFNYRSAYFKRFEDLYDIQKANWNLTFQFLNNAIKPILKAL